jgi:monovalent cation:H+ antiporter-2, CPA2 family
MADYSLITTLVAAIVLAFVFGFAAQRLKLPTIVGYILAGVMVGPHTPGFVGDIDLALQLAEIGVILLMFGVGLKLSLPDLWAVRGVALPGALVQMTTATLLGWGSGLLLGLGHAESLLLGFSLSVASTVVLLRALEERRLVKSHQGRLCVGWLVVEDIAIVLGIVALPALVATWGPAADGAAGLQQPIGVTLGLTIIKIAAFVAVMIVVGGRVFPWLIVRVAHTKSRELMSLCALALALGIAYTAYAVFDASFALGAFLAGVALNGAAISHNVAENSLPLRDTFAVLFFVSVGMLFDPNVLVDYPLGVAVVVAIIVVGKGAAALALTSLFRLPRSTGLFVAAALAQIGEFSFVLASMGAALGVLSPLSYNLILAGALFSIMLNPLTFKLAERIGGPVEAAEPAQARQS